MFDQDNDNTQAPLPFECSSCFYKMIGRCNGPVTYETYIMQDEWLITCTNTQRRQRFFDDLYSRMPPIPKSSHQYRIELPAFIPVINDGLKAIPLPPQTLFAVSLETFLGRKGTIRWNSIEVLRQKLGLPPNARLALIGTAKDSKIERLWTTSDDENVWHRIANFGFDFVTSISYSVYDEQPRADQIYNQDRNFVTHDFLVNAGASCIPFIYPYCDDDYQDAFAWLHDRPDIEKVAVLAQFVRTEKQFRQFVHNMRLIQDGVKRPIKFLVVGIAKPDYISCIMSEFAATIVTSKPFEKARSGCGILADFSYLKSDECRSIPRSQLVANNISRYSLFCDR